MELVVPWEVLLNEPYEKLSDVSLDLLVVWRVKPKDFPFPVSVAAWVGIAFGRRRTRCFSMRSRRYFWPFQIPHECKTSRRSFC